MKNIQIYKINSLIEAIYYHNLILDNDEIILDFRKSTFIRNNYLSIIGLALEKLKQKDGKYEIKFPLNKKVLKSMRDIKFNDRNKTMIKYTNIKDENDENLYLFYEYFQNKLLGKVQNISDKLANKIIQKVFELFSNVFRHSKSELGLFCSGQFYPSNNKFYFTIVDGGVGIKYNVNNYLEYQKK